MRTIRIIALSLAGLTIIALIVAAIIPEILVIEKNIKIDRPVGQVFNQVADLNNWENWNPWSKLDPEAIDTVSTPSRGVGASWKWEGEKIGRGSLITEELTESRYLRFSVRFEEPFPSQATDVWTFTPDSAGGTTVSWNNSMELEYPIGRLSSLFIKPVLEEQFEVGLQSLKQVVEQEAPQALR